MERAPLEIYANRSGIELGQKICEYLNMHLDRTLQLRHTYVREKIEQFPCGEFKITLESSVRGKDVFLIQCPIDKSAKNRSIQDNVWETLQSLDTLKFCHARSVTLVMPCLPYSRQDKRDGRESCSALLLSKLIARAGADAIITMDLHASQIKEFYSGQDVKPDALYSTKIFIDYLKKIYDLSNMVILAPDEGSAKRARFFALQLFEEPEDKIADRLVFTIKQRNYKTASTVTSATILGDVKDKQVLIVDDLFDTAGTVQRSILAAKEAGAKDVIICGPHAVLSDPATERLDDLYKKGILKEFITTDTIVQPEGYAKAHPWFRSFSVAPMLAKIIDKINKEGDTSSLYL
jgi:ribose-phosphate pyrophosphokinase